jgi:hypothetical protein
MNWKGFERTRLWPSRDLGVCLDRFTLTGAGPRFELVVSPPSTTNEGGGCYGYYTRRGQLICDDTRRNQISSFGEADESI